MSRCVLRCPLFASFPRPQIGLLAHHHDPETWCVVPVADSIAPRSSSASSQTSPRPIRQRRDFNANILDLEVVMDHGWFALLRRLRR